MVEVNFPTAYMERNVAKCLMYWLVIGHFHDDDIWLQLPEFISLLLSYLNLSIPLRVKEQ